MPQRLGSATRPARDGARRTWRRGAIAGAKPAARHCRRHACQTTTGPGRCPDRLLAPPGFCYAVKANRYLTQAKKLKDCAEPLARMMGAVRHLEPALGPLLFQLPPRFHLNIERLESFLRLLPGDVTSVFEFRESSWYDDAVFALLERHDASFCAHDMPGSPSPRLAIGPVAYLRFHGSISKYWGRYSDKALLEAADWIVEQARAGRPVWAYFNNDPEAQAIHDAQTLRGMVRQALR